MPQLVEDQGAVGQQTVEEGVGHRPGLLVDLLAHEVGVAALPGGLQVPVDGALLGTTSCRPGWSPGWTRSQLDDLVVVQDDEVRVRPSRAGMSEARRAARRSTPTTRGDTRRAATMGSARRTAPRPRRRTPGPVAGRPGPRRPASRPARPGPPRPGGPAPRCRCPDQQVAGRHQLVRQLPVVLDDAVVDQGQAGRCSPVGVGVLLGRPAVGGPAGVADAGAGRRGRLPAAWPGLERPGAVGGPGPPQPVRARATRATPAES